MKTKVYGIFILIFTIVLFTKCNGQEAKQELLNRDPAVAGAFYSKNPQTLKSDLENLFDLAEDKKTDQKIRAVIVPHAGYVYSGIVAASAYNQIDAKAEYENVFIIGSSHKTSFSGASIYSAGNYNMPLGEVQVNTFLAKKLIDENDFFHYYRDAHMFEHSIEVQIPFLQYHLQQDFKIVPIIIGSQDLETPQKLASALLPYFTEKNLFVISSDFSHYPSYEDAQNVDSLTLKGILKGNSADFISALVKNEQKGTNNLATSCCGWTSVLTLLHLMELTQNIELQHMLYQNSGDVSNGDKKRVVGYHAIVGYESNTKTEIQEKNINFEFSKEEKNALLNLARKTIEEKVKKGKVSQLSATDFPPNLHAEFGAFVTLHKHGNLRGCIGRFTANQPLYEVIQEMAVAAATEDTRFQPVSSVEIEALEIEISVLSPMRKIASIDEIELGKHGIYIKKGFRSGTFLPQVASETGWNLEEFLGHCARDKAGIGWDGWKDAEIYIYEAYVFSENE